MIKKLRLLLFEECNRNCEGCCNKDWDLKNLPIAPKSYYEFQQILLTGGEPLIKPEFTERVIREVINRTHASVYLYTAKIDDIYLVKYLLRFLNGITVTLHDNNDASDFLKLCKNLFNNDIRDKSLRVNIFKNVNVREEQIPFYWKVKSNIEWIKNCPLPEGEVFMKYSPIIE